MKDNQNDVEINLVELFFFLLRKAVLILVVAVVCAAVGFIGTKLFIDREYTASTRVYMLSRSDEAMVMYSDYQISSEMLSDYKVLITGRNVTKEVVQLLKLDMHYTDLARKISVTSPEDSRFVQINVTDTDPVRAAAIANTVREVASVQIKELMDVDAVNLVYEAEVPERATGPNTMLNTVLVTGGGVMLTLAVLIVVYVLDDSMKTEEDVLRYMGLSVMGVIPDTEELSSFSKPKKKQPGKWEKKVASEVKRGG